MSSGNGVTGYIEMNAIYDTIVRYNVQTGKYDLNTAESVTGNADSTEWTVKLKPNIKFSDGTAYDAEAVKFGMNRHRSGITGAPPCAELWACPRNVTSSCCLHGSGQEHRCGRPVDGEVHAHRTMADLPVRAVGRSGADPVTDVDQEVSRGARRQAVRDQPEAGRRGAVQDRLEYKTKDSITMVKNPDYFGGAPYLDGIKFVNSIADARWRLRRSHALSTGTFNMAFLRDPAAVAAAHEKKFDGVSTLEQGGGILLINQGNSVTCAAGHAGTDRAPASPTESS